MKEQSLQRSAVRQKKNTHKTKIMSNSGYIGTVA